MSSVTISPRSTTVAISNSPTVVEIRNTPITVTIARVGVQGPPGTGGSGGGTVGPQGPAGADGQIRFTGTGPPGVIIGAQPNDTYLDVSTGVIYKLT